MKAIRLHTLGGPEVLQYEEVPQPTPKAGELLIKVAAAGINYADVMSRQGVYPLPDGQQLPIIPGFEVAGTVVAQGEGVTTPEAGTRIIAGFGAGYAEYVAVPAMAAVPIPDEVDFAEATALFLQGLTAYGLLREGGRLQKGESVLVHAAAGGVGSLALQLAKIFGASTVIGTSSKPEKLAFINELGADSAVNYESENWADQVNSITDHQGINLILESVGGSIGERSLSLLSTRGRMVVYGSASGSPTIISAQDMMYKGHSVIGYSMGALTSPEQMAAWTQELFNYVVQGKLRVHVGQTFPLSQAAEAHRAIEARQTIGKVVLLPDGIS